MRREFTGKHLTLVMIGGFGIVVAVNFAMAFVATKGFGGVVVENSYVASQKFNGWLDEAEKQRSLGWQATPQRDDQNRLSVATEAVPDNALVTARLRRPLGQPDHMELSLPYAMPGLYRSSDPLPEGRWLVRLSIQSGGEQWQSESEVR